MSTSEPDDWDDEEDEYEEEDGRELDDDNEDDDCDVDRIVGNYHYCQGDKEPDAPY